MPDGDTNDTLLYFTVSEANKLVARLAKLFARVMQLRSQLKQLYQQLEDAGFAPEGEELHGTLDTADDLPNDAPADIIQAYVRFRALMSTLREQVDQVHDTGVVIKDIESGLVDWPALHKGREIWLCWKYGESEVRFWHEVDAGFDDRLPIADLDLG